MLWFNRHRRNRERLSAYIDGELPPDDALALESHVEACDACAEELAGLRLASAALAELPEVEAPRSFALTAADIARPVGLPTGVRSVTSGLRLTGAALAAALAVVLVLDAGGIVGNGEGSPREEPGDVPFAAMGQTDKSAEFDEGLGQDAASGSAQGYIATESPTPEISGTPEAPATGGQGGVGGGVGGGGGAASTSTPMPTPAPAAATQEPLPATGGDGETLPSPEATSAADALRSAMGNTPTPTAVPGDVAAELGLNGLENEDTETLQSPDSNADSDDGPSALAVTEIVLAALLGASIVGIAAATYAERRRG